MAEGDAALVNEECREQMEKALRNLKVELQKVRTGRANAAMLDGIQVDYYGTPTPLNQLANFTIPDPRLIVISPYDKGSMQDIEKAIMTSDLGLSPNNDGKVVRIPIPPLTEERRKELVRRVGRLAEDHKVGVRDARREALSMFKDLANSSDISEDERRRAEKDTQKLTDDSIKAIEDTASQKEEEILQV
jgi:ribosome recycling factor